MPTQIATSDAQAVFGDKIVRYAQLRGISLDCEEVANLCLALHLAWDVLKNQAYMKEDRVFGLAIMSTMNNQQAEIIDWAAKMLCIVYRIGRWKFNRPMRSLDENRRAMSWLMKDGSFVELSMAIFQVKHPGFVAAS